MRLARAMGLPAASFLSDSNAETVKSPLERAQYFHAADAPLLSETDIITLAREVSRSQVLAELVQSKVLENYETTKPGSKPWRNGYDLANTLRDELGLHDRIQNLQVLLEDKLGILVAKHAFSDVRLRGVAVRSSNGRLAAVSSRLPTPLLRISLAHELCHHLCDLSANDTIAESGDETDEVDGSGSDPAVERRAKAFAVMFLAPSALVREMFGSPAHQFTTASKALDRARELSARCGLSTTASLWHLFHLKYLSDREHDIEVWQCQVGKDDVLSDFEQTSGSSDGLQRAIDAALAADEIETDQANWLRSL